MGKNDTYMIKTNLSTQYVSRASRAVWPAETHRRPFMAQSEQQQRLHQQQRAFLYDSHKMLVSPSGVHFFYTYMFFALCTGTVTTWMFFLHQWLLLSLIAIIYCTLMVLLLRSLVTHGYGQKGKRDEVVKKGTASFLPAGSPITPMPPSIGKTATLQAYYAQHPQRSAPRTPLPEDPLIRVLETVNLKEE